MSEYPVLREGPRMDGNGRRLRHGGCICGAVRFTVAGEPDDVGLCHCLECRKATGAVAMPYANWPRTAFSFSGEVREFVGRSFCPLCGTRLFNIEAERVAIMLGAFDEAPGDLRPTREGWIIRREHWLAPVADAAQFARDAG